MKKGIILLSVFLLFVVALSNSALAKSIVLPRIIVGASSNEVSTQIIVENSDVQEMTVRTYVSIPELGIRSPLQCMQGINPEKQKKAIMMTDTPAETPEYVRIYVSNGKEHRIKYVPYEWW